MIWIDGLVLAIALSALFLQNNRTYRLLFSLILVNHIAIMSVESAGQHSHALTRLLCLSIFIVGAFLVGMTLFSEANKSGKEQDL